MTERLHGLARNKMLPVVGLVLLIAVIFAAHLLTPAGVPEAIAYAAVVLLASWLPWRHTPLALAAVCSALILASFMLSPGGGELVATVVNRGLAVFVLWAIALLARQRRRAEEQVRHVNAALEQRVAERTGQLEAAVRDLEAFSASVAHDLRSPLRAMHGYATLLLEDYTSQLDADGQQALQRIASNALRLGHLIDDLLMLAHLSRQPLAKQRVAPADLVQQAWEDLRPAREHRQVDFALGALAPCEADPVLLRQVFVCLLDNALKFTAGREVACITVGCQAIHGERVYVVQDNGVGFDMQYAHKLFGVFQRLHRSEEYEGNGMGLALAQRMIERHGGRIWASAQVDKGATFYIAL